MTEMLRHLQSLARLRRRAAAVLSRMALPVECNFICRRKLFEAVQIAGEETDILPAHPGAERNDLLHVLHSGLPRGRSRAAHQDISPVPVLLRRVYDRPHQSPSPDHADAP